MERQPPHARRAVPSDRVWVVGPPGSGKSTLAQRLARRHAVEPTALDELHWLPGWIERPYEAMRAELDEIVARPRWVIDGNYTRYREAYLDRIQLTVWLDFPLRITLPRLALRGIRRSRKQERVCNGNTESLRRTFLHKDSLLLWALTTDRLRRKTLAAEVATRPHVRLRSQREVDRWLMEAGGASRDGPPEGGDERSPQD